jgi:hypothetical protein
LRRGPPFGTSIDAVSVLAFTTTMFEMEGAGPLPPESISLAPGTKPLPDTVTATVLGTPAWSGVMESTETPVDGSLTVTGWLALSPAPSSSVTVSVTV